MGRDEHINFLCLIGPMELFADQEDFIYLSLYYLGATPHTSGTSSLCGSWESLQMILRAMWYWELNLEDPKGKIYIQVFEPFSQFHPFWKILDQVSLNYSLWFISGLPKTFIRSVAACPSYQLTHPEPTVFMCGMWTTLSDSLLSFVS